MASSLALAALMLAATAAGSAPPAQAAPAGSVLGVPCAPGPGSTRVCTGSIANRVRSWDGVPLDVDIYLPPDDGEPDPLIVGLHGFGATKVGAFESPDYPTERAREGYAVIAYSARGQGFSCGVPVSRTGGCEEGWIHLADARYEVRDTQHLAGLLVDEGLVKPRRIGATGSSYGGGQSLMLAALRDRTMLHSGRLVPWRSPDGRRMRLAAAAPRIGWSDLAYALAPTGRKLDYRGHNPYGHKAGITKDSYLQALYAAGLPGFYAPPGADPSADVTTWKNALDAGPPYDRELLARILRELRRYRSPYSVQDQLPRSKRRAPAPTVIYNGWTDDIMPVDQALTYSERTRRRFPQAKLGLVFEATFAHPRGSLAAQPKLHDEARDGLFKRYLMRERSVEPPGGVVTTTQGCRGAPALGPFETRSWRAQHPGEVHVHDRAKQVFTSAGGDEANSLATDPLASGSDCPTVDAARDPGAATYLGRRAAGDGYTLLGSPTVTARLRTRGRFAQVSARLWDVAPDGRQTMVQHSIYKPRSRGTHTFQLHPNGWHFAAGHRPKLELLGRDSPYMQEPAGDYEVVVRRLRLELPVRERADGRQVRRYSPPPVR